MNDRGIVKWAPFNSVINGNQLLDEINYERNRISKPILSEEQIADLEENIITAYSERSIINLYFYKNGCINIINGQITKLDPVNKIITINNKTRIYFNNIIDILEKNTWFLYLILLLLVCCWWGISSAG